MSKILPKFNQTLNNNNKISNTQGIKIAYDKDNKIFVKDNKMFVGGTVNSNDWKRILQN